MASWASLIPLLGLLYVAGTLLVAIGLLRLRRRSPSTRAHLIGLLAIIAVALPDIVAVTAAGVQIQPGPMLAAVASAIASGYLLSVPIGAWIDGEPARPFWSVLAVIALFQLVIPLLDAATISLATRGTEPASYSPTGLTGIVAGGAALVTLWAYARALPEAAPEPI